MPHDRTALLAVVGALQQPTPRRHWRLAFGASLALVTLPCLFGASLFLYLEAASGAAPAALPAPSPAPIAVRAPNTSSSSPAPRIAKETTSRGTDSRDAKAPLAPAAAPRYRDAASAWQKPGLCPGQTPAQLAARSAYLNNLRRYE